MRYFFAIFFPPLAVLSLGKPFSAIFNFFLLFFGWFPAVIHAMWLVRGSEDTGRHKAQMRGLQENQDILIGQIELENLRYQRQVSRETGRGQVPRHLKKRKRTSAAF